MWGTRVKSVLCALAIAPANEILASIPADSSRRAEAEEGINQMKGGFMSVLAGAETSLGERSFYSEADLAVLVAALADCMPSFALSLSINQRTELRNKFRRRKSEFKGKTTLAHFDTLIATLTPPGK